MNPRSPDREQVKRYREDGYLIMPGLFGPQELEPLQKAYEEGSTTHHSNACARTSAAATPKPIRCSGPS